jgi:hypothetical protein
VWWGRGVALTLNRRRAYPEKKISCGGPANCCSATLSRIPATWRKLACNGDGNPRINDADEARLVYLRLVLQPHHVRSTSARNQNQIRMALDLSCTSRPDSSAGKIRRCQVRPPIPSLPDMCLAIICTPLGTCRCKTF